MDHPPDVVALGNIAGMLNLSSYARLAVGADWGVSSFKLALVGRVISFILFIPRIRGCRQIFGERLGDELLVMTMLLLNAVLRYMFPPNYIS